MPLLDGTDDNILHENIKELRRTGYPEDQALAIALKKQRMSGVQGDVPAVALNVGTPKPVKAPKADPDAATEATEPPDDEAREKE